MTDTAGVFASALSAHRVGRIDEALAGYRILLATEPGHLRARHLLGFGLLQRGAAEEAESLLAGSAAAAPGSPDVWAHLGLARNALGRRLAAQAALRRALALAPGQLDAADGLTQLGLALESRSPIRLAERLVTLAPLRPAGWHKLGLAHAPRDVGAACPLAAERCLRRAVLLEPREPAAVVDLAETLRLRRNPLEAARWARQATRMKPDSAAARVILAAAQLELDRTDAADQMARSAAILSPQSADAYGNWAQCHYRRGRFDSALAAGRRARTAAPDDPRILANLSSYHLAAGDLESGWQLFSWRPARLAIARAAAGGHGHDWLGEEWRGEDGARLLVLAEQGLGDELLFASCWPDLAAAVRTGRLSAARVEIDPRLRPLAARSHPELQWLDRDRNAGPIDGARRSADFAATHWAVAGDLPAVFRRTIADFPTSAGYLKPDPARVTAYREWLNTVAPADHRLGFCWRSGLLTGDRARHYPSLVDCRPLLRAPWYRLVALQYDGIDVEVATAAQDGDRPILVPPGLDRRDDLDGVAALIAALDGVLSADTAVLAMAGAVGAPTVGFGIAPNWIMLGGAHPPWHPSVKRVFRQDDENWEAAMRRIALSELDHLRASA